MVDDLRDKDRKNAKASQMGGVQHVSRSGEKGWNDDNSLSSLICTPFTGQLVKGDFLCVIPMNSKNIALTCIGKGNIRKHLKAFPKGGFA